MDDSLKTEQRGTYLEIVLNRPEKRNAINADLYESLSQAIDEAGRTPGLRAVLLRGAGQAFSAGIDVTEFLRLPQVYGAQWQQRARTITDAYQRVLNKVERLELPTIALLHGYCLGLGLELALACDIRLAARGTMLGLPETRLGIIPDVGGTTRLVRLIGPGRAKEVIFSGRQIEADLAEKWGIVNRVVEPGLLQETGEKLAAEISAAAPLAVGMAKRVIDGLADIDRGLQLEGWAQSQLLATEDFMEGVQSMMAGRQPEFKGR